MPTNSYRVLPFPSPSLPRVAPASNAGDEALLGPSAAIARVWSQIRRVAPHFRAAIVTGEPGCGAEAVGRALHLLSPMSRLPFLALDAAQAEQASRHAPGCHEGVIFLAELERLTPEAQRSLLRKLRLRGHPLRVIGSAVSDLRPSVSAGRFSPELAECLAAIRIALPPLRERKEDLPLLAEHLSQRAAAQLGIEQPVLDDSFHEASVAFPWPGNLPQLESVLVKMLSDGRSECFTAEDFHLAAVSVAAPPQPAEPVEARMVPLEDIVQEHIRAVLVASNGNKLRAAEILGISRSTLYRMLDSYNADQSLPMAG